MASDLKACFQLVDLAIMFKQDAKRSCSEVITKLAAVHYRSSTYHAHMANTRKNFFFNRFFFTSAARVPAQAS